MIIPLNYSGREERVLKKSMFDIEPRNVVDIISCLYVVLVVGILSNRY